jgi:hypothetical protein
MLTQSPVSSSLASSLIFLTLMACEGIEAMLCSIRMLVESVASSFEHHSLPELARNLFLAIRGIQDGKSSIHSLFQLKKNSGTGSLFWEGILKRSGSQNLENKSSRHGDARKEATSKEVAMINSGTSMSKGHNRGHYIGEIVYGNSERLQIVLGFLTVSSARGEVAKSSTEKGNYRGQQ